MSLRDVERAMIVFTYFCVKMKHFKEAAMSFDQKV